MHSFDETKLSYSQRDILNRCLKDNSLVKNLNRESFHYNIFKVCTSLSVLLNLRNVYAKNFIKYRMPFFQYRSSNYRSS